MANLQPFYGEYLACRSSRHAGKHGAGAGYFSHQWLRPPVGFGVSSPAALLT
jgi:hypothetical protein